MPHLTGQRGFGGKSEIRNSKSERKSKREIRNSKTTSLIWKLAIRIWSFLRISDFFAGSVADSHDRRFMGPRLARRVRGRSGGSKRPGGHDLNTAEPPSDRANPEPRLDPPTATSGPNADATGRATHFVFVDAKSPSRRGSQRESRKKGGGKGRQMGMNDFSLQRLADWNRSDRIGKDLEISKPIPAIFLTLRSFAPSRLCVVRLQREVRRAPDAKPARLWDVAGSALISAPRFVGPRRILCGR
jgi:hypothetical protein